MDQVKTGALLKELRTQKGLTQEQLAEIVHVSNRTVSRWENGYNLPDLDVLIELADYYTIMKLICERCWMEKEKETKWTKLWKKPS